MVKHQLHLFTRHSWEPLQELVNSGAAFKIFEQRPHWHAAVFEQPLASALAGDAFDRQLHMLQSNMMGILGWDHSPAS